jgi:hypothetical protein
VPKKWKNISINKLCDNNCVIPGQYLAGKKNGRGKKKKWEMGDVELN